MSFPSATSQGQTDFSLWFLCPLSLSALNDDKLIKVSSSVFGDITRWTLNGRRFCAISVVAQFKSWTSFLLNGQSQGVGAPYEQTIAVIVSFTLSFWLTVSLSLISKILESSFHQTIGMWFFFLLKVWSAWPTWTFCWTNFECHEFLMYDIRKEQLFCCKVATSQIFI